MEEAHISDVVFFFLLQSARLNLRDTQEEKYRVLAVSTRNIKHLCLEKDDKCYGTY